MATVTDTTRPDFDKLIQDIVDYVLNYDVTCSAEAMQTARYSWMDSIGCALLALDYPACTKLLGSIVPGATLQDESSRVPGTSYQLDPVRAAWNIGAMIRWLDYNDTWLAAEWGHPSDNLGAIMALADYISRRNMAENKPSLSMKDILIAMIKAHEIQGVIALENSFNRVGLDHVILVRIASTAISAQMLGCNRDECLNAVSHAWLDGSSLRTYRHAPNTGSRKSWAAGDATSRGLFLAFMAQRGEMGYPSAITAKGWGFQDVCFNGKPLEIKQEFGTYTMENILFKISFPAEFHAQTAVEAAIILHSEVKDKLDEIDKIILTTQESADRIINKNGPLDNPADRDHCLQYMVAIGLIKGKLTAEDYEDEAASNPLIDVLRGKMEVSVDQRFSDEYLEADKRAIGNAIQVFFKDGGATQKIVVDYPVGHRRRRDEGIPLLKQKFEHNLGTQLKQKNCDQIIELCADQATFENTSVDKIMRLLTI